MLRDFFIGAPDERKVQPLNSNITGTVPIQHSLSEGAKSIENLSIVRKCIGYIADMINETVPQIVDNSGNVVADWYELPRWIRQPSAEFVLEELVQQCIWSLFVTGNLEILAQVGTKGRPAAMYVATSALSVSNGPNGLIYYDNSQSGKGTIKANAIVHRRRFAVPGRSRGIGEIDPSRTLLNAALHAQDAMGKFFASNMHLDLIFTLEGELRKGAGDDLLMQLAKKHAGGRNAFRPIVSEGSWKVDRLKDSNQSNQVVELMNLIDNRIITTVFGIDPLVFSMGQSSVSGASLTYQNASNLRSQVWLQSVKPLAKLIEACISEYLPTGQHFKFAATDLLRGSPSDRAMLVQGMALASQYNQRLTFSLEEQREVLGYSGEPPEPVQPKNIAAEHAVDTGEFSIEAALAKLTADVR